MRGRRRPIFILSRPDAKKLPSRKIRIHICTAVNAYWGSSAWYYCRFYGALPQPFSTPRGAFQWGSSAVLPPFFLCRSPHAILRKAPGDRQLGELRILTGGIGKGSIARCPEDSIVQRSTSVLDITPDNGHTGGLEISSSGPPKAVLGPGGAGNVHLQGGNLSTLFGRRPMSKARERTA